MFKREKKEKQDLVKEGGMTKEEYEMWKKDASPKKVEKKSKVIMKVQ